MEKDMEKDESMTLQMLQFCGDPRLRVLLCMTEGVRFSSGTKQLWLLMRLKKFRETNIEL
ncbi:MAG: hypothetical protein C0390_10030 [Syntrophus sp. (in: bacteria)]|nr:hypothetical protein [Syntrophus sp. (in: bacteria)]